VERGFLPLVLVKAVELAALLTKFEEDAILLAETEETLPDDAVLLAVTELLEDIAPPLAICWS